MSLNRRVVSLDSSSYGCHRNSSFGERTHSDERSYSSGSVMQPLSFNRVHDDIAHPLSSLRSCSEFGLNGLQTTGQQPQGARKKSLWKKFLRWASRNPEPDRVTHDMYDIVRHPESDRRDTSVSHSHAIPAFFSPERSTSRSMSGERSRTPLPFCTPPSKKIDPPATGTSVLDELSLAMDFLFGLHANKSAPKEIELKDLKNPSAIAQLSVYREPTEFPGLPMQRTLSMRSLQGSVDEARSSLSQASDSSAHSATPPFHWTRAEHWRTLLMGIVDPYTAFIRSRCMEGDNELFYSLQCQPFSSVLYLRGMLSSGMNNTLFHTYTLLFLPQFSTQVSLVTLCFQRLMCFLLGLQVLLNLLATPTRSILHYNCWHSSRCFDVESASQALQQLIQSDMWMINRVFAWTLDAIGVFALVCGQLYLWYDALLVDKLEDNQALTALVVGMCATNMVSFLLRAGVAIIYFLSFVDTRAGRQGRRRGGLSNFDLGRMPTFVFSCRDDVVNCECAICLSEFEMGEMLISLPCHERHSFHANCIREWLVRQNVCPLCQKIF